jgi:hypothetical protein
MDRRELLTLESAVTAIEEAASAVEAELNRSQLALEKIIQEETA